MFLVFFEVGIKSLSDKGKLGFITPNSFIHNSTYIDFRKYIFNHKLMRDLIDFKRKQIFENASTYSAITILDQIHNSMIINYYEYIDSKVQHINKINLAHQDLKKWIFTNEKDAMLINYVKNSNRKISDSAIVQYGFATLLDKAYIIKDNKITLDKEDLIYPVVKGSRYDGKNINSKIIYPYIVNGDGYWKPIIEDDLKERYPDIYLHLLHYKVALQNRSLDNSIQFWYEYGRSQAIQTIHNEKLVISPILKDYIKVFKVNKNTMIYSGIYLFTKDNSEYRLDDFLYILKSKDFLRYAQIVGKDMRGGYKTINTKMIKDYMIEKSVLNQ